MTGEQPQLKPELAEGQSVLLELLSETDWRNYLAHQLSPQLSLSQRRIDDLLDRLPGIIFSQRPDFSYSFVAPRLVEWTGIPLPEWRAKPKTFWDVIYEADVKTLMARFQSDSCSRTGINSTYRIRNIKTGRITYLWEYRDVIRASNGAVLGFEGIALDITRQTIAEERLLNSAWQENLGILSMGLAHDFCNLMTGIVGLTETFGSGPAVEEALRQGLGMIRQTAMQASQLAHRLGRLHQDVPGQKSYQDLNQAVGAMAEILQKTLPRGVKVKTLLGPGSLPIYIDLVELQQVIINLALNASEAMPQGGEILFQTAAHATLPQLQIRSGSLPQVPAVRLSVQDTGAGIPENLLGSIFEPFVTTKSSGKGSGLGLYNARLFAEKHRAAISLDTNKNGTTFHIWFRQADLEECQPAE